MKKFSAALKAGRARKRRPKVPSGASRPEAPTRNFGLELTPPHFPGGDGTFKKGEMRRVQLYATACNFRKKYNISRKISIGHKSSLLGSKIELWICTAARLTGFKGGVLAEHDLSSHMFISETSLKHKHTHSTAALKICTKNYNAKASGKILVNCTRHLHIGTDQRKMLVSSFWCIKIFTYSISKFPKSLIFLGK